MALGFFGKSGGGAGDGGMPPAFALHAMIAEVRGYWQALRQGAELPPRAAIDPRGLRGALEGAFLIERIAPGMGRLRIAGMNFTDLMGMDARGMPLSALFDPMGRARLGTQLEQVFLRPAVLDLTLDCETGLGRPTLRGRMILLPLAGNGARAETALGCLALAGQIGRAPRRLTITASRLECITPESPDLRRPSARLTASERLAPETLAPGADRPGKPEVAQPADQAAGMARAFAEAPAAYEVKHNAKAKPWARLVDLGRG